MADTQDQGAGCGARGRGLGYWLLGAAVALGGCGDGSVYEGAGGGAPGSDTACSAGCVEGDDGRRSAGDGTGEPGAPEDAFDLGSDPSHGVVVDEHGDLVLDERRSDDEVIWIANTGEGTVSKVDTRSFEELARYRVGPGEAEDDPSRTSVNTFGDVYVGNRRGGSVTKISMLGDRCPDTNGDGAVTTSSGADDVLPWGEDDCVLWHTPLPDGGLIRAVAAQDVDTLDGVVFPYVWIGGYDEVVWKLDGESGDILVRTEAPVAPYGFALDGTGNLWMSTRRGNYLARLDTTRCVDEASCRAETCGEDGDTCVKQRIELPGTPYGITVDYDQRVWLGGDDIYRYDPEGVPASRLVTVSVGTMTHGIAADGSGWIWAGGMEAGVFRVDADTPTDWAVVPGTELSAKGMAVDSEGKIWAINREHDDATVIVPGPTLADAAVETGVAPNLVSPYTYSDMTGQQLRLATNPRGYYRRTFEGCPAGREMSTLWHELHWEGDAPPGTRLLWRARTAASREELAAARWVSVGVVPPDSSPLDLQGAFASEGIEPGRLLEIEVQLERTESAAEGVTPRVSSFVATLSCSERII